MHRPRKRFGQNFLVDPTTIQSLISAIAPKKSDDILEIGPGLGALTSPLLKRVDRLEVVELDRNLINHLTQLETSDKELIIHQYDALKFDFSSTEIPRRIVGNLPYNISTPLIFHLLDHLDCVVDMHFMLQKEVVERICAQSGNRNFGRLAAMVQSKCTALRLIEVPPEKFSPAPKVTSAFLRLTPRDSRLVPAELETTFKEVVKDSFSQPRKTITNNLKDNFSQKMIEAADVDPSIRPQQLRLDDLLRLAKLKQNE